MNPYAGCYVECVKGRWRVSFPDGSIASFGSYRKRQDAEAFLDNLIKIGGDA